MSWWTGNPYDPSLRDRLAVASLGLRVVMGALGLHISQVHASLGAQSNKAAFVQGLQIAKVHLVLSPARRRHPWVS